MLVRVTQWRMSGHTNLMTFITQSTLITIDYASFREEGKIKSVDRWVKKNLKYARLSSLLLYPL